MAEEMKKYFGDPMTGIWALLVAFLFLGISIHANDWNSYWALWLGEMLAYALMALFFYANKDQPNGATAIAILGGSTMWLINQLMCWYYGELSHTDYATSMKVLGPTYLITMFISAGLLIYAYTKMNEDTRTSPLGWSTENTASLGLVIMILFGVGKLYTIYHTWQLSGGIGFIPGSAQFNSAFLWGLGITLVAVSSLIYQRSSGDSNKNIGVYMGVIGLLVAASAALYYGLALSLTGFP